jgi:hypothetical protein
MVRRNPQALREATIAALFDYTVTLPVWFDIQLSGPLRIRCEYSLIFFWGRKYGYTRKWQYATPR